MPRGLKGERRPADAIGNANMIAKIATGEIKDITTDPRTARMPPPWRMGGKARADNLNPKRRKEIAKRAANARWKKGRPVRETTG
jgi:hypothetical protein